MPARARVPELPRPDRLEPGDETSLAPGSTSTRRSSRRRRRPARSRRGRRSVCHEVLRRPRHRRRAWLCWRRHAAARRRVTWPARSNTRDSVLGAAERSGRLRRLHALPRGAELARPRQQRSVRQVEAHVAATRRQQLPGPGGPDGLQAPAPERRQRADPRSGAAGEGARRWRSPGACAAHGVPNFPDPGSDGRIPDPASVGIDQGSPKFEAANQACRKYRPPYMPSNAAYNAYARTHG